MFNDWRGGGGGGRGGGWVREEKEWREMVGLIWCVAPKNKTHCYLFQFSIGDIHLEIYLSK